jgi:hypothetical protein
MPPARLQIIGLIDVPRDDALVYLHTTIDLHKSGIKCAWRHLVASGYAPARPAALRVVSRWITNPNSPGTAHIVCQLVSWPDSI